MNFLAWLCAAMAVLIGEGHAFSTFGDNVHPMSNIPLCRPGYCVVMEGRLCPCDQEGNAICYRGSYPNVVISCSCTPGEVFPSDVRCICPMSGVVTSNDCPYSFRPPKTEYSLHSNVRNVEGTNVRKPSPFLLQGCGFWRCYSNEEGVTVCYWVPCINPPNENFKN